MPGRSHQTFIVRHSRSRKAEVRLYARQDCLCVEARDSGVGFRYTTSPGGSCRLAGNTVQGSADRWSRNNQQCTGPENLNFISEKCQKSSMSTSHRERTDSCRQMCSGLNGVAWRPFFPAKLSDTLCAGNSLFVLRPCPPVRSRRLVNETVSILRRSLSPPPFREFQ